MYDIEKPIIQDEAKSSSPQTGQPVRVMHRLRRIIIIIICTVLLLIIGIGSYFSGVLPFAYAAVRCGKAPIPTSRFAASYSYTRPGDSDYGPSPFSDHYYCTEQQAIDNGYRGSGGSLSDLREKQLKAKSIEDSKFAQSKIPFKAYYPSYLPVGYILGEAKIEDMNGPQVLQEATKKDSSTILLRQGETTSNYAACNLALCQPVGKDAQGYIVYRSHSDNNGSTFWEVMIDGAFYNIETGWNLELSIDDVIKMFSSLKPLL